MEFKNGGRVDLTSLTSIPPGVVFRNGGSVYLKSLTSLPPGVEFKNVNDAYLKSLTGGWFDEWIGNIKCIDIKSLWSGNIKGIKVIDSKRLLNLMIKKGMFI